MPFNKHLDYINSFFYLPHKTVAKLTRNSLFAMWLRFPLLVITFILTVICHAATSSELKQSNAEHPDMFPSENIIPTNRFLRSDKNADTEKYKDDEERATESGTIKAIAFHIQQSIKTWAKNTKNWMLVNQGASFDELYQKGVQPSQYFEALGLKKLFDTKAAAHAARYGDEKILSITDPKYLKFWKYKMHWNGKLMEKNRVVENLV